MSKAKNIANATPAALGFSMPAEWEKHEATWLGWPHNSTDWPEKPALGAQDFLAAAAIFLIVVLATFPVALPFIVLREVSTSLLISRVLTIVMLFGAGFALGRHAGFGGWMAGLAMTVLGVALTVAIILLGG